MDSGFDKFDNPSYSDDDIEFEDEGIAAQVKPVIGLLKKNAKLLIAVLLIVVVGFFLYDFFIGSVRNVSITIVDAENDPVEKSRITIFDNAGTEVFAGQAEDAYSLQLKAGTYQFDLRVPDHKAKKGDLTISESGPVEFIVEKDIDVEIVDFKDVFPGQWIAGQNRTVMFEVKNNDNVSQNVEIVFGGELDEWGVSDKSVPGISAGGTKTVALEVTVPKDLDLGGKKDGAKEFKASARVKYTLEKQTKEFTVSPAPEIDFSIKNLGEKRGKKVDAGEVITNALVTIENESDFPIEDLEILIEIKSAPTNGGASRVINWFKFQEKANEPEPWKINIPRIEEEDLENKVEKQVRIDIPLTAKKETITGEVILSASFLPQPMRKSFNIIIEKEAEVKLELTAKDNIGIEWLSGPGFEYYENVSEILKVKNDGELAIRGVDISVSNYQVCTTDWLQLLGTHINVLEGGETREITMQASAPISQHNNEKPMLCKLKYKFDNPLAGSSGQPDFITGEMENWISIEPEPE